ncbi:MerR family transcriptional regulator, partial [Alistipes putredinis]|nr:MerR family transcriptional regulator [Alistipes putredinis]
IKDPAFNPLEALRAHLDHLYKEEQNLRLLIETVKKTIQMEEGKIRMTDQEKFAALKRELIEENEEKYGKELREKYGDSMIENSNQNMLNLTAKEYYAMI